MARVEWAAGQMPVLARVGERFAAERPLEGKRVAVCLHVTAETANLVRALAAGGAEVALAAANPLSTQDDVAAALVESDGVAVLAVHGETLDRYAEHVAALVAFAPHLAVDDGADLVVALNEDEGSAGDLLGATEETTTGLVRLRRLEGAGELRVPVIAANESRIERAFNDRFGTGQSALDGIVRATNVLLSGSVVVVLGYGWTGKGIALSAKGHGATVIVCEVDSLRALEARMEGFEVMPSLEAAARGDIFITVTGGREVLGARHFAAMRDGAIVANAGHFDVEVDIGALEEASASRREARPLVEEFVVDGRRINLLAHGRVVNLAAAEGHPAAVMDLSFALQALALERLATGEGPGPGVHPVPEELDREVARLKLDSLGVEIDSLTAEQAEYLRAWLPAPHDG